MAINLSAQIDKWALKTQKRLDIVVKQATGDMIGRAGETTTGKTRGGEYRRGYVPRADGGLAASLQSSLNGQGGATGEDSYTAVIAGMEAGDTAFFGWTAEYALHVHYGTAKMDGWFWVTDAVVNWQGYVDDAVRRAKAAVA